MKIPKNKTLKKKKEKEKGCTEPLYGNKAKCIIKIVPQDEKGQSLQIDKKCVKKRKEKLYEKEKEKEGEK